jgi:hypothetical protein
MSSAARRTLLALVLIAGACSVDGNSERPPAPVFGATPGPCGVTILTNDVGDEARLGSAVGCALGEVDAGRAFTWDLLVPTVEGDPILHRFTGDGEKITIITDATRDAFGSSSVLTQVCETITDTGFVPSGVDCTGSGGEPFELPSGVWPP